MTEEMWYEIYTFGEGSYPDFTDWRLVPVSAAEEAGTPADSMPPESEVPFSHQFFLVNNQIKQLRGMRDQSRPQRTKFGMAASEYANGSLDMLNVRNSVNVGLLRYHLSNLSNVLRGVTGKIRRVTAHRTEESSSLARLEFVPDSVEDVDLEDPESYLRQDELNTQNWNGGIDPKALLGQYNGLDYNNLTRVVDPEDEQVYINGEFTNN
ncbi:hypothetical protein AA313_de0201718 [Arthrobotrys entomopaga]|nr:hypothetical protein AA313_de0201718 [Arthrobotrys entomopaga]